MLIAIISSLWLGIVTSISPCPLATNIVATSFISKNIKNPQKAILSGFLYTLGRVITYMFLGSILISGILAIPSVANFLQGYINKLIAPILIFTGLLLLDVIKLNFSFGICKNSVYEKFKNSTTLGAFILGIIFALSFCPVSAALFFGNLTTLAIEHHSRFLLPLVYGIGTGIPVMFFAIIIAFAVHKVGEVYNLITRIESWFRKITGMIFIFAGISFLIRHYII
ncbi:aromatic aminobenezylarsenical efflux permease ArsG family transporter [Candidatus Ruminimicrobiellum ovillum]|uniref:aromatic aminobenezylarsenical efflux permease ArsG family transporter n=1 Tax=Candidatus Ruminimicrobiellum ovillum TaxID=1947927 RepID=UPI00355A7827